MHFFFQTRPIRRRTQEGRRAHPPPPPPPPRSGERNATRLQYVNRNRIRIFPVRRAVLFSLFVNIILGIYCVLFEKYRIPVAFEHRIYRRQNDRRVYTILLLLLLSSYTYGNNSNNNIQVDLRAPEGIT